MPVNPPRKPASSPEEKKTMTDAWSHDPELESKAKDLPPLERSKFLDIPSYLHFWTQEHGGLQGKKVLDFGCGFGTTSAGVALLTRPKLVVGVDINDEHVNCGKFLRGAFGMDCLPGNLVLETIEPGAGLPHDGFDFVYAWSVFEHVDNPIFGQVLRGVVERIKPGGLFFVQISPLYYSAEGSHLWALGYRNWEHLTKQISEIHDELMSNSSLSTQAKTSLWSMFMGLNRITAAELLARFTGAGLTLKRAQRDVSAIEPPPGLSSVYQPDVLSNYQIVALFQKGP